MEQFKQNNTGERVSYKPELNGNSLTGATADFVMVQGSMTFVNAPAIVDETNSLLVYDFTARDTLYPGNYIGEFRVVLADGTVKHYPKEGYLKVRIDRVLDPSETTRSEDSIALRVSAVEEFKAEINTKVETMEQSATYAQTQGDYAKAQGEAVDSKVTAAVIAKVPEEVDSRVGSLANLGTTNKTSVVSAVNEVNEQLAENTQEINKIKKKYVPSTITPAITTTLISSMTIDMRPFYVDPEGYIWGNRKISGLSLVRATKPDLSDAVVVKTLPGGVSNTWRNIIRIKPGKLAAYVMSGDSAQAGFYLIDDSDPSSITYTRVSPAFPTGDPDPALQTFAKSDDGQYLWACTYSAKNDANPPFYIYRSTDYGQTWEESYRHITNLNTHIHCVAWDSYRNRIWACIGDENLGGRAGIAYSDQYGATGTWTFIEAEAMPRHMVISAIPLPDRVIFGSDRVPAGILQWKPSGGRENFSQPPVVNADFTQTHYAQPTTDTQNLGFSGKPGIDTSTFPYKIVLPFGNVETYSKAWLWFTPDGDKFYMSNFKDSPKTNPDWIRYIAGITKPDAEAPNGWVIGVSQWVGGDEYFYRFKFPDWYLV